MNVLKFIVNYIIPLFFSGIFVYLNVIIFNNEIDIVKNLDKIKEKISNRKYFLRFNREEDNKISYNIDLEMLKDATKNLKSLHPNYLTTFTENQTNNYFIENNETKSTNKFTSSIIEYLFKKDLNEKYNFLIDLKPNFYEKYVSSNDGKQLLEKRLTFFGKEYEENPKESTCCFYENMDSDERIEYDEYVKNKSAFELLNDILFIDEVVIEDENGNFSELTSEILDSINDETNLILSNDNHIGPSIFEKIITPAINLEYTEQEISSFYILEDVETIFSKLSDLLEIDFYEKIPNNRQEEIIKMFIFKLKLRDCDESIESADIGKICQHVLYVNIEENVDRCSAESNGVEKEFFDKFCIEMICQNIGIKNSFLLDDCNKYVKRKNFTKENLLTNPYKLKWVDEKIYNNILTRRNQYQRRDKLSETDCFNKYVTK